jgi:predicted AAA+ superfamily ATPase
MWIRRGLEHRVRRSARTRPVLVLTGARQTGKTALLRRLFPALHFVSLDLPSEAEQADKDPAAFLARHPLPLARR